MSLSKIRSQQSRSRSPWNDPQPDPPADLGDSGDSRDSQGERDSEEKTLAPLERIRDRVGFYLEDIETFYGRLINLSVVLLVVISSGLFVAQTFELPEPLRHRLQLLDQAILGIFILEYLLRLWSARRPLSYLICPYSIIDLLAILPFFVVSTDLLYIRLLRWFRILRLARFVHGKTAFGYISSEDGTILARILFTLFAIIFIFSGLIYQVEHPINSGFDTFTDAFYFAIVTMTTVGYGDVTPISDLGQLLTILMILTGIALIPWQVGDLIKRLIKTTHQTQISCVNCGTALHDVDANFCRICGTPLSSIVVEGVEPSPSAQGAGGWEPEH